MHNIKRILPRAVLVAAFVVLLQELVTFLYLPYDRYSIFANREYRAEKGKIDTLFLGTSQVYYGLDPAQFNEELGVNSFNLGTGSQSMFVAYQLLEEALDINPVNQVILGISFSSLMKKETDDAVLGGYDRLITLTGKLRYILADSNSKRQINELFYSTRVTDYLNLKLVKKNIQKKLDPDYETTKPSASDNAYSFRGYRTTSQVFNGERTSDENASYHKWNREKIIPENETYFRKILELCREKDITVHLVLLPVSEAFLEDAGDTEDMHQYFAEAAKNYGAEFHDFLNLENREELFSNEYFRDIDHLNTRGAHVLGNLLIEEMKKTP
ncbi:MAG: SGNH/GDSL hydrolase family protein [Candidatus Limivivens sp.]|nr:SGNH/GDSL hydrolase family protein [Candidatus Limivivens sp.]